MTETKTLRTVLLVFLILLIIGALPAWPHAANWGLGYYPSGGFLLVLLAILFLA